MKKVALLLFICLILTACGAEEQQPVQMGNPWTDHGTLSQAEEAVEFSLELPETVADTYTATAFRTMSGTLLEVIYTAGDSQITLRKQAGEGQDISGDYTDYPTVEEIYMGAGTVIEKTDGKSRLALVYRDGFSYSLSADEGCSEACFEAFLREILA